MVSALHINHMKLGESPLSYCAMYIEKVYPELAQMVLCLVEKKRVRTILTELPR